MSNKTYIVQYDTNGKEPKGKYATTAISMVAALNLVTKHIANFGDAFGHKAKITSVYEVETLPVTIRDSQGEDKGGNH